MINALEASLVALLAVISITIANAGNMPIRLSGDCEEHYIVNSPSDTDGAIVKTEDGHIYEIDEIDRIDSQLWLTGDDVLICWSSYSYDQNIITLYTIRDGDDKDDATRLH